MSEQSSSYVFRPESPMTAGVKRAHEETSLATSTSTSPTNQEHLKPYACVTCSRRKVRCDKKEPCSTCQKSGTQCVFRAPAPPQRRKRRAPETILLERLRRAEDLLKGLGVKVDPTTENNETRPSNQQIRNSISTSHSVGLQNRPAEVGQKVPPVQAGSGVPAAEASWGEGRSNFILRYGSATCKKAYINLFQAPWKTTPTKR